METPTKFWDLVKERLELLPEEGPLTRTEVETWARWHLTLVNCFEQRQWTYRGASIRYDGWATLLVVKGAHEGTPYVCFVTERTTTDCMRVFLRMMDEGRVEWKEDKFG
jgi:hypothetical protein